MPDWTFKGSTLDGWKAVGQASWTASNGELVGTPKAPEGGWLILDKSFQDLQFGADFRCAAGCKTGVLFRAEKTADGGMKGIYVSLTPGETGSFAVTTAVRERPSTQCTAILPPHHSALRSRGATPCHNASKRSSGMQPSASGR